MLEMPSVGCNAGLQSLAPFPDCSVNDLLIKTVSLLFDALPQFFRVLDMVLAIYAVLHSLSRRKVDGI